MNGDDARPRVPKLTDEERAAATAAACAARARRAEVKAAYAAGALSTADVMALRGEKAVARMRVAELVRSRRGYGRFRTEELLRRLGIRAKTLGSLGERQVESLTAALDGRGGRDH